MRELCMLLVGAIVLYGLFVWGVLLLFIIAENIGRPIKAFLAGADRCIGGLVKTSWFGRWIERCIARSRLR